MKKDLEKYKDKCGRLKEKSKRDTIKEENLFEHDENLNIELEELNEVISIL